MSLQKSLTVKGAARTLKELGTVHLIRVVGSQRPSEARKEELLLIGVPLPTSLTLKSVELSGSTTTIKTDISCTERGCQTGVLGTSEQLS